MGAKHGGVPIQHGSGTPKINFVIIIKLNSIFFIIQSTMRLKDADAMPKCIHHEKTALIRDFTAQTYMYVKIEFWR